MIPNIANIEIKEPSPTDLPSKTYALNPNDNTINDKVDALQAVEQAIYKILNTERYDYVIYSWNYGVELKDLYGKRKGYVCSELKRRISEALLQDNRITKVDDFTFDTSLKGKITTTFTVTTVIGSIKEQKEVEIDV